VTIGLISVLLDGKIKQYKNHLKRLKQENIFKWLDVGFFLNRETSKFHLTASLLDHIHKPRYQTKHCAAAILQHNNKLTSDMCLLVF